MWKNIAIFKSQESEEEKLNKLILESRSYNGYIREAAVCALPAFKNEKVIAVLLERVNDWVPQVRERALHSLRSLFVESCVQYFVTNLKTVYHLKKCGRADHNRFIREVENYLIGYSISLVKNKVLLNSKNSLYLVRILAKSKHLDKRTLVKNCISHGDPIVKEYAVNFLSNIDEESKKSFVLTLLNDKSAKVRRAALRYTCKNYPDVLMSRADYFLLDSHSVVRTEAIFYLQKRHYNCIDVYLKKLGSKELQEQRIAIWGITELFAKDYISEILPYLESPFASTRYLALKACYVLEDEKILENILFKALLDESPKVVKEACRMLIKSPAYKSEKDYVEVVKKQRSEKTYKAVLRLVNKQNKWKSLLVLSELSASSSNQLKEEVNLAFSKWLERFKKNFVVPTPEQKKVIISLHPKYKVLWSRSVEDIVNYWLKI